MTDPIVRIAEALERIARALEQQVYGTTTDDVAISRDLLRRDLERERAERER